MKKKSMAVILAAMLILTMASCGSKKTDNSTDTNTAATENTAAVQYPTDEDGNIIGTKQEGAVDEVNMNKVKGEKLSQTTPEDDSLQASGELSGIKVSIDSAKLVDTNEGQAIVVAFTFKNDTANPVSFDGLFDVEATEGGVSFTPTAVVGVEGINVTSPTQLIESGQTATVQKTYEYNGEEVMNVTVQIYGQPTGDMIGTAFELK
ncbi:MAG: DUF5067 domain-containing protein [Candidatus Ornithomonoglobus sp.]